MTKDEELTRLKDDLMKRIAASGILKDFERYWNLRAELAARSLTQVFDRERTDAVRGQITICYEMEDLARTARESAEANANGRSGGTTSLGSWSAV